MPRFATRAATPPPLPSNRPAPHSLGAATPARTAEGGDGFVGDARHELFSAVVSGLLADGFYESGDARRDRVAGLVHEVAATDPAWVREFAVWARDTANLRSAPLVVALEYAATGAPGARQLVDSVCRRADEPGEALAYWRTFHGRSVPSRVKRGVADAVGRLYTERAVARYDGADRVWRFGDVIEVVHPDPWHDQRRSALYKYLLDRRRHPHEPVPAALTDLAHLRRFMDATPAQRAEWRDRAMADGDAALRSALPRALSWEALAAATPGGLDEAWWTALVLSGRLSGLGLLRNLNNLDRAGAASAEVRRAVEADLLNVERSRALPFRYLTAYLASESGRWAQALEAAADAALTGLPELPGRTLIMVDCSGSMSDSVGAGKSRRPLRRAQVAAFLAEALARRAQEVAIVTYADVCRRAIAPQAHVPVLRAVERGEYAPGGGTSTWHCVGQALASGPWPDRVLVLTDEQTSDRDPGYDVPVVTWNLAGVRFSHARHGARNRYVVHGYSDTAMLTLPDVLGFGTDGRWPWERQPAG